MASQGLVFITKSTFTGVSEVLIDGCFSATYQRYYLVASHIGSTTDDDVQIQLRSGGVTATGADYRVQRIDFQSTTVAVIRYTGLSDFAIGPLGRTTTANQISFNETWIQNPFEARRTSLMYDMITKPSETRYYWNSAEHDLATSYDGFRAFPTGGTITGNILVYGLAKS